MMVSGPDYKFPSSKSICTILNKWHIISITWSNGKNLSNCWSNGEKLMTFNTGNKKGSDHQSRFQRPILGKAITVYNYLYNK